jgi:Regulator of chromosome condensation (RCC1) repeat
MLKMRFNNFIFSRYTIFGLFAAVLHCANASAQFVNSWINPFSAHWEDSASWSLGSLPGASESIFITNAGYKAVGIFPSTPVHFPASMTVSNLTISAPNNALSTLLLNYSGTAVPLHVIGPCVVGTNGTLMNLYARLQVDSDLTIKGGQYVEEGGTVSPTNATFHVQNGNVYLTNTTLALAGISLSGSSLVQSGGNITLGEYLVSGGDFALIGGTLTGNCYIGAGASGTFHQYSGTNSGPINIGIPFQLNPPGSGTYSLYNGLCVAPGIALGKGGNSLSGVFTQSGGTLICGAVSLGEAVFNGNHSQGTFTVSGGKLFASSISAQSGSISLQGGQVIVTNGIGVAGVYFDYFTPAFASCSFSNGNLYCGSIGLGIFGTFGQQGGSNFVSGDVTMQDTTFSLGGGVLTTSNTIVYHGSRVTSDGYHFHSQFDHRGGSHIVRNTLAIGDYYNFYAGNLSVNGISLSGPLAFYADVPTATFTNTGILDLAGGTIVLYTNVSHNLGKVRLSANTTISFLGGSQYNFSNSSAVAWSNGVSLTFTNWNGSINGGGANRIYFGADVTGLTPVQLQQVQFRNPAGFPPGNYVARILPTGEIVPMGSLSVAGWGYPDLATAPGGLSGVTAIASGTFISMALRTNGTVVSWGGTPDNPYYYQVKLPDDLTNVVAIAAGEGLSLALLGDGTVVVAPDGFYSTTTPPPGLSNVVGIAGGGGFAVAVKADSTVTSWGYSQFGQTNVPNGLSNVVAVTAGGNFSVALKADGTATAWGDNYYNVTNVPSGLSNVIEVSARAYHAIALRSDGTVVGWGDSLGTNVPASLSNVVSIAAGGSFNLALLANGTIVSWDGYDAPTNVAGYLTNVVAVAAGSVGLAILGNSYPQPFALARPQIDQNGTVALGLSGRLGQHYAIQSSSNLAQWSFFQNAPGKINAAALSDQANSARARFYRAVRVP